MLIGNLPPKVVSKLHIDDKISDKEMSMIRRWEFYMLGRLICGDDCLAQVFRNHKPINKFRYQIQARDYNEGIAWGEMCAKEVFSTKDYYSYQKDNGKGLFNTIILLTKKDVNFLFEGKFIKNRRDFKKFKSETALALIKDIPFNKLLRFNGTELVEFLAGCFDSDGVIRPKKPGMYICLDSQTGNRKDPLAYKQIQLFKKWSEQNKMPKILKVKIISPPHAIKRAKKFHFRIKKIFKNTELKIYENSKGVKINIYFSCDVRNCLNREIWNFWIKEVAKRLIRKDKKIKFLRFYRNKTKYFSLQKASRMTLKNFGKKLANFIDSDNAYFLLKRPSYPQCEIRIKFLSLNEAKKMKNKIEKTLNCGAGLSKRNKTYFVSFYISSKNYLEIESFVLPYITTRRKKIKIKNYINMRYAGVAESGYAVACRATYRGSKGSP